MNYLQKQNDLQNQVDELLGLVWKKQKRIRELEALVERAYREGFIDGIDVVQPR